MTVKTKSLPDIKILKSEVVETIAKNLGVTKTAFFLRETMPQKTDYLEIKEALFGKKPLLNFIVRFLHGKIRYNLNSK